MYRWLLIRLKSRLGIPLGDPELEYIQLGIIEKFPGIHRVSIDNGLGSFVSLDNRQLYFRLSPHSDMEVLKQVIVDREYATTVAEFRENFPLATAGLRIIDAGANVGYTAAYFFAEFLNSQLVCIEPDAGNVKILGLNLRHELNSGKAILLQKALMSKSGINIETRTDFRDGKDWSISVAETEEESGLKSVNVQEIMQTMHWDGIDILKIDIEGAERFVFEKGTDHSWLQNVKLIALEIHDEFAVREHINELLRHYSFKLAEHGETTVGINRRLMARGN